MPALKTRMKSFRLRLVSQVTFYCALKLVAGVEFPSSAYGRFTGKLKKVIGESNDQRVLPSALETREAVHGVTDAV